MSDFEELLTSYPDMTKTILDSPSFRRAFVMQSERSQNDFVARYDATLL